MKYLLINILFLISFALNAQIGGQATYEFLNLPNSPKVAALGGKLISQYSNDLSLTYYNPALLNSQMQNHLTLNYVNYFLDINYGYVGYMPNSEKFKNYATGIHFINYGKFIKADELGNITGEFGASEYALNLTWAKNIDSLFSVGVNAKPIFSILESYWSIGLVTDVGVVYNNTNSLLTVAFLIRNLGMQLKTYNDLREPVPFEIQLGLTKKLIHAPFRLNFILHHLEKYDLTYEIPDDTEYLGYSSQNPDEKNKAEIFADNFLRHLNAGVEFVPSDNFYFALGYNFQRSKELRLKTKTSTVGLSWGFGMRIAKFNIGYSRAHYHLAGSTNQFSITTNLSELFVKR